ncbi:MAG: hypothetical protein IPL33_07030 [Sphingobacteriales bacterium]|nr:hypothetical protein [Sphingobacteriales bacterium]
MHQVPDEWDDVYIPNTSTTTFVYPIVDASAGTINSIKHGIWCVHHNYRKWRLSHQKHRIQQRRHSPMAGLPAKNARCPFRQVGFVCLSRTAQMPNGGKTQNMPYWIDLCPKAYILYTLPTEQITSAVCF